MTKKHFEIIALILAETLTNTVVLEKAIDILRSTNPRFDAGRFREAVSDMMRGNRPSGFSKALWEDYSGYKAI